MTTATLQIHCECCNAPATATFEDDEFRGVTCSKHGTVLMVPQHQVEAMRAVLAERLGSHRRKPDGYAYRYHSNSLSGGTVIRFSNGEDINGGQPIEAIPFFYGAPAPQPARAPAQPSGGELDAVLRERERTAGLVRRLRDALDPSHVADNLPDERALVAEADAYLAAHDAQPAPAPAQPSGFLSKHCQNGNADVCRASQRDGVVCPDDSCDIDDGIRPKDTPAQPSGGAWRECRSAVIEALAAIVNVPSRETPDCRELIDSSPVMSQVGRIRDAMAAFDAALAQQPGAQPPTLPPVSDDDVATAIEAWFDDLRDGVPIGNRMRAALEAYRASLAGVPVGGA